MGAVEWSIGFERSGAVAAVFSKGVEKVFDVDGGAFSVNVLELLQS